MRKQVKAKIHQETISKEAHKYLESIKSRDIRVISRYSGCTDPEYIGKESQSQEIGFHPIRSERSKSHL
jgi:hypothetical protein